MRFTINKTRNESVLNFVFSKALWAVILLKKTSPWKFSLRFPKFTEQFPSQHLQKLFKMTNEWWKLLNYKKLKTFKLNVFKFKNNFCYIAKNISILVFTDVEVLIWQSLALS